MTVKELFTSGGQPIFLYQFIIPDYSGDVVVLFQSPRLITKDELDAVKQAYMKGDKKPNEFGYMDWLMKCFDLKAIELEDINNYG